jgi:hypothetical protein
VQAVDKNRDGEVDFEEFLLLMKESVTAKGTELSRERISLRDRAKSLFKKSQIAWRCIVCCR